MGDAGSKRFFQWGPRESAVLPLTLTLEGAMTMTQAVGVSWPTTWIIFRPERDQRAGRLRGTWLSGLPELIEVGGTCFDHIKAQGAQKLFDDVRCCTKELESVFSKIRNPGLRDLSDEALADLYELFRTAYVAWWRPNYVVEPLEYFAEGQARRIFGDAGTLVGIAAPPARTMEGDIKAALDAVVTRALEMPHASDAMLDKNFSLFASLVRKDGELAALVEAIRSNFFWIRNNYYRSGSLTFDEACALAIQHCIDLRKGAAEHIEHDIEAKLRQAARRKVQRAAAEIAESDTRQDATALLELWDYLPQFKDDRKRTNLVANHHLELLLRESAHRRHVALADVRNLLPSEVSPFIRGESITTLLDRRFGIVVLWRSGEPEVQCLYEPDLAALAFGGIGAQLERAAARAESGRVIEGTGNGYGVVEGVAYVCETYHDALRIPPGDGAILLTYMTSPEWLEIMSRVQGVVTVEGGQASHAFLSCGQMRKPLIIGAQGAVDPSLHGASVRLDSTSGVLQVLKAAR